MIDAFSVTIIIICVFLAVLLLQMKVLNKVASQQYNIEEQMQAKSNSDNNPTDIKNNDNPSHA